MGMTRLIGSGMSTSVGECMLHVLERKPERQDWDERILVGWWGCNCQAGGLEADLRADLLKKDAVKRTWS